MGSHKTFLTELRQCEDLFEDSHPRITHREAALVLRVLLRGNLKQERFAQALRCVDKRGDGELSLPEFVTLMMVYDDPGAGAWENDLHAAFRVLVESPGGKVSKQDLIDLVCNTNTGDSKPSKQEFEELWKQAGLGSSLDLVEFVRFFQPPH